ncbi:MAG: type II toxin-antitoxin system VapC family toxin [Microcoleus sp.]
MQYRTIFVDTWGWLALGHRRDNYHQQVKNLYYSLQSNSVEIYTSDYVLDELISLLFKREIYSEAVKFFTSLLKSADLGYIKIERVTNERFLAAWELRQKLADKPNISFTDLTSMIIMQDLGIQYVLTQDNHFIQVGMGLIKVP